MAISKVLVKAVTEKEYTKDGETKKVWKVVIGDKEYACFNEKIKPLEGKEVELDLYESGGRLYAKLPHDPGDKKPTGGRPSFGRSAEDLALTAKTMSASYAKDLVVAYLEKSGMDFNGVLDAFGIAYDSVYGKITAGAMQRLPESVAKPSDPTERKQEPVPPPKAEPPAPKSAPPPLKKAQAKPEPDNERVICRGANKKLAGKLVSLKTFCPNCFSFKSKTCDPFVKEPVVTTPAKAAMTDQQFAQAMSVEMRRTGMKAHFEVLEQYGCEYAEEVPPEQREGVLVTMRALPNSDIPF